MAPVAPTVHYKSPLHKMTQTTPTCLWNDSASVEELTYSIEHGAVGATCNPSIAVSVLKQELAVWKPRILALAAEYSLNEDDLSWRIVEEISANAARLLLPIFEREKGRNGRLSIQTDPRNYRNTEAMLAQAVHFSQLAPNMIVKIAATRAGIPAIEEATYRGISINATVSFTLPQAIAVAQSVERGLRRREAEGLDISTMGPICTLMVGRLDDWQRRYNESDIEVIPRIDNPVDRRIVDCLLSKFPDFERAYSENGLTPAEFDAFGSTRRTLRQFIAACAEMNSIVRDIILPNPDTE